jgi:hypothetical protein
MSPTADTINVKADIRVNKHIGYNVLHHMLTRTAEMKMAGTASTDAGCLNPHTVRWEHQRWIHFGRLFPSVDHHSTAIPVLAKWLKNMYKACTQT